MRLSTDLTVFGKVERDGAFDPLELELTAIIEANLFSSAKLTHHVGRHYFARRAFVANPGRELDRGAEQVLFLLDRLAGIDADADAGAGARRRAGDCY